MGMGHSTFLVGMSDVEGVKNLFCVCVCVGVGGVCMCVKVRSKELDI